MYRIPMDNNQSLSTVDLSCEKILRQHNAMTDANYFITAFEKFLLTVFQRMANENDPPDKIYKLSVKELQQLLGREMNYSYLKKTAQQMVKRKIFLTSFDSNRQDYLQLNLLSSAEYEDGVLTLEISPEIRHLFFGLKNNYTSFSYKMALQLESIYSKRIYEMLCRWKDKKTWRVSIDKLKLSLFLKQPNSSKEKYKNFADFKKRVLDVAEKEINEKTDIFFKYKATKEGKKFTDLKFTIAHNPAQPSKMVKRGISKDRPREIIEEEQDPGALAVWKNCLAYIKGKISEKDFETWFEPIIPYKIKENTLTLQVPSQFFFEWLEENYLGLLKEVIHYALGRDGKLMYSVITDRIPSSFYHKKK